MATIREINEHMTRARQEFERASIALKDTLSVSAERARDAFACLGFQLSAKYAGGTVRNPLGAAGRVSAVPSRPGRALVRTLRLP